MRPSPAKRIRCGNRPITLKAIQARSAAITEAAKIPSFASSSSATPKVMSAMSRDTVNPIPDTVATPTICGHCTTRGKPPNRRRVASHAAPVMPAILPRTRPARMPIVMGELAARCSASEFNSTPALASANSGTIT